MPTIQQLTRKPRMQKVYREKARLYREGMHELP